MKHRLFSAIAFAAALAAPLAAQASEPEFLCSHNYKTDYWISNRNPIIYDSGVRVKIDKTYGSGSSTEIPTLVKSLDGQTLYKMGDYAGIFGGLKHYQVCVALLTPDQ
jgi:hypothetical protein